MPIGNVRGLQGGVWGLDFYAAGGSSVSTVMQCYACAAIVCVQQMIAPHSMCNVQPRRPVLVVSSATATVPSIWCLGAAACCRLLLTC